MKKQIVFHPLIFALFPALSMYASNVREVAFIDTVRSLLFSIFLATFLLFGFRVVFKNWQRAAIFTTLMLVFIFSYGHLYSQIKSLRIGSVFIGRHRSLLPLCVLLLGGFSILLLKRVRVTESVNHFLNIVSLPLFIVPVFISLSYALQTTSTDPIFSSGDQSLTLEETTSSHEELPDIYYIILDGYARLDILAELYDFDNTEFESFLRENNFYIAEGSTSNYSQTNLSLVSTLNMDYVNNLADVLGENSRNLKPLGEMLWNSKVRTILADLNYQMVSFETGYGFTEIGDTPHYWSSGGNPVDHNPLFFLDSSINPFETQFVDSTVLRAVLDLRTKIQGSVRQLVIDPAYQLHRNRILYTFDRLLEVEKMEGNFFVFAHIIAPHPPFVFGPNGEEILNSRAYSLADGSYYVGSPDYVIGYLDQLTFVNTMLERTIAQILEEATVPPIILLQADHGPGAHLEWRDPDETLLIERMSILNAYHLPNGDGGLLYEAITPVNTFRVIFNQYFGATFDLLEDRNYFSSPDSPYKFLEVTNVIQD